MVLLSGNDGTVSAFEGRDHIGIEVGGEPQIVFRPTKVGVAEIDCEIRKKIGQISPLSDPGFETMHTIGVAKKIQTFGFPPLSQP
jgi:hypothetical protein